MTSSKVLGKITKVLQSNQEIPLDQSFTINITTYMFFLSKVKEKCEFQTPLEDKIRFMVRSSALKYPISTRLILSVQMTSSKVLGKITKVLQSNQEIPLDQSFTINITTYMFFLSKVKEKCEFQTPLEDKIRFMVRSSALKYPISTRLILSVQMTSSKVLGKIIKVPQSNQEIPLDQSFTINIIGIKDHIFFSFMTHFRSTYACTGLIDYPVSAKLKGKFGTRSSSISAVVKQSRARQIPTLSSKF